MESRPLLLAGVCLALLASPALAYNGPTSAPAQPASVTSTTPATRRAMPATTPTNVTAPATRSLTSNTREARNASLYRRAEQKLQDMGLYAGPVDGTRNALYVRSLETFQRSHHLQINGRLTRQTMRALGI